MSRIRRVMHPTDFSRASSAAFKRAVELAKGNRTALTLVHVMSPSATLMTDTYIAPQVYEDMAAANRASAQKQLERIAGAARSRKADLIVIGTHGRTGFAKFFLGSVASRVLAVAPCPVLTVRGRAS